jgi:hypothetical protein
MCIVIANRHYASYRITPRTISLTMNPMDKKLKVDPPAGHLLSEPQRCPSRTSICACFPPKDQCMPAELPPALSTSYNAPVSPVRIYHHH